MLKGIIFEFEDFYHKKMLFSVLQWILYCYVPCYQPVPINTPPVYQEVTVADDWLGNFSLVWCS